MGEIEPKRIQPLIGRTFSSSRDRVLLIACYDPVGISTIPEQIAYWQILSRFHIEVLNLWPGAGGHLAVPSGVDLRDFAGLILHPTVSYNPRNLGNLDSQIATKFADFEGIKVIAKQDEHYFSRYYSEYIKAHRFDMLLTCVPPPELQKVYPRDVIGDVEIFHTLTGYVTAEMRNAKHRPFSSRSLDISYRGSIQPLSFGRLGFEKRKIGNDVCSHSATAKLRHDISSRWEDRLPGDSWKEFLADSRAVLGVESGSNLFDFDGDVEAACADYAKTSALDPLSDEFYFAADRLFLNRYEGNVNYAQISPRHFEAAAAGAAQVLYEGAYSGIFAAGRHYFPLERDLSNWEEIIVSLRTGSKKIAEAAFEEVVLDPKLSYEHFVAEFDDRFERLRDSRGRRSPSRTPHANRPRVLVLCAHEPTVDPRIDWMASAFSQDCFVCELGIHSQGGTEAGPTLEEVEASRSRVRVDSRYSSQPWLAPAGEMSRWATPGLLQLSILAGYEHARSSDIARATGAHGASPGALSRFAWYCKFFVRANSALYQAAINSGPFDCIVAADLHTLPAAVALKSIWGAHLVYDSHEYCAFSDTRFESWENAFWANIERSLVPHADTCLTVSDTLADQLSRDYGVTFEPVPNAVPLRVGHFDENAARVPGEHDILVFLFQGNFAVERGLDHTITAWQDAPPSAHLHLRGPGNQERDKLIELAKGLGLLDRTVFFPEAVKEEDLVSAAGTADVALIPYNPTHYAYRFACPNKLSQYMAAGRPIVVSPIQFVADVIRRGNCGYVVDFRNKDSLLSTIRHCLDNRVEVAEKGSNAFRVFKESFNWQVVAGPVVQRIISQLRQQKSSRSPIDFSWVHTDRTMVAPAIDEPHRPSIDYWERTFGELQAAYSSSLSSCMTDLNNILREYAAALFSADGETIVPVLSTSKEWLQVITAKVEIEEEFARFSTQVDQLRRQRATALGEGKRHEVDAAFDRQEALSIRFFDVLPKLYDGFVEAYKRARDNFIRETTILSVNNLPRSAPLAVVKGVGRRIPGIRYASWLIRKGRK